MEKTVGIAHFYLRAKLGVRILLPSHDRTHPRLRKAYDTVISPSGVRLEHFPAAGRTASV